MKAGFALALAGALILAVVLWSRATPDPPTQPVAAQPADDAHATSASPTTPVEREGSPASPATAPIALPEGYPTWKDLPAAHQPTAMGDLQLKLEDWLDEREGAEAASVGALDCSQVPCLLPVSVPSGDEELRALVHEGAEELFGAAAITVPQTLDDGSTKLWFYWNPPEAPDGRWSSQMQLAATQRVMR